MCFHLHSLISPLFFLLSDIIAEVYGVKESKKLLYSSLVILGVIAFLLSFLVQLGAHIDIAKDVSNLPNLTPAYTAVFSDLFKIYGIMFFAILISGYINIWAISRWKILLKGRYFWIRSVSASAIALIIYSLIGSGLSPYLLKTGFVLKIILIGFIFKILYLAVFAYPMAFLCTILKSVEKTDEDYQKGFNPFAKEL